MFDAISPFDERPPTFIGGDAVPDGGPAPALVAGGRGAGWGQLDLAFARRDGATHLAGLYQKTPLRAFFPHHESGNLAVAAIANVGGGLVAGDTARLNVAVGADAAALVTSQAAEKVYRSTGADCRVETSLTVAERGWLEWCPQETILFERARLRRSLRLDLAGSARAMLAESLVLGRLASGEQTGQGLLHDRIEVHVDGHLSWHDSLRLDGVFDPILAATAGLGGARAIATFVYVAADAEQRLDLARSLLPGAPVAAGATSVDGLLIARFLAQDALALRLAFTLFWAGFRAAVAGLPPVLPRLWHV
ncbi:MAG: urease accessory protein UreD [Geminicoccaceae bacterium]